MKFWNLLAARWRPVALLLGLAALALPCASQELQFPIYEFEVRGNSLLSTDAIEASQQTFETANVLVDEPGLDLSKLARPTSTWTYMVHDNPLRDDSLSAMSLPGVFR
jgi:hypothetical protein